MFSLDRELAEVKMSAVTSRFVYISRHRLDIINRVKGGEVLSLVLDVQDDVNRPRKFPTYFITRYPVDVDPSLAKELEGVHTVRRFLQDGKSINRIVITWSHPDPPPPFVNFSFLPCLPSCELRRMPDEKPWCFKCWGIGHISRYCAAPEKCAFCAAEYDSRTCPHRPPVPPTVVDSSSASTSSSLPLPTPDSSHWKCPRCNEPGVNVWHGCTRRSGSASNQLIAQQLPVPSIKPHCYCLLTSDYTS
ncbi:uncharacterized protein LOC135224879 [Macrobrachium nipponense]|uniref:uncharacterized protein LOC135224879 n=1 Tax=Macrobrachium nipponense TaxID=159736 RepID=UPI0030C8C33D